MKKQILIAVAALLASTLQTIALLDLDPNSEVDAKFQYLTTQSIKLFKDKPLPFTKKELKHTALVIEFITCAKNITDQQAQDLFLGKRITYTPEANTQTTTPSQESITLTELLQHLDPEDNIQPTTTTQEAIINYEHFLAETIFEAYAEATLEFIFNTPDPHTEL